jgi:hypothetical protein
VAFFKGGKMRRFRIFRPHPGTGKFNPLLTWRSAGSIESQSNMDKLSSANPSFLCE